jgi:hypothetical protein
VTLDGIELVRSIGRERNVIMPMTVEILKKPCFEACNQAQGACLRMEPNCRDSWNIGDITPGGMQSVGKDSF